MQVELSADTKNFPLCFFRKGFTQVFGYDFFPVTYSIINDHEKYITYAV